MSNFDKMVSPDVINTLRGGAAPEPVRATTPAQQPAAGNTVIDFGALAAQKGKDLAAKRDVSFKDAIAARKQSPSVDVDAAAEAARNGRFSADSKAVSVSIKPQETPAVASNTQSRGIS